jgi:hypothetical protein
VKSLAISLMMGTEMSPETSVIFNRLTRLIAQEDFINLAAVKVPGFIKTAVLAGKRHFLCFRADSGARNNDYNNENGVFSAVRG